MAKVKEVIECKAGAIWRGVLRTCVEEKAYLSGVEVHIYEYKGLLSSWFKVVLEGEESACEDVIREIEAQLRIQFEDMDEIKRLKERR